MLRPKALEKLAWHRSRGHWCVLLSASPALYVEPWARAAGFDEVLATRLRYDADGHVAGLDGENCRGEEKVRRLEAQYGELAGLEMVGYGDSPADRAFLARCAEAHYKPFTAAPPRNDPRDLLRLVRPHQWVKNAFVFVGVIFGGFILRILAGTIGIGIAPSQWLLVCTLLLTLFLGFVKRRSEQFSVSGEFIIHRKALLQYSAALLDKLISICGAGAIMSYSLYTMSPDVARLHGTAHLVYTIPFVIYGMFRYLYLLHAKHAGTDTSGDLLRDPHLLAAVGGWGVVSFALISGAFG